MKPGSHGLVGIGLIVAASACIGGPFTVAAAVTQVPVSPSVQAAPADDPAQFYVLSFTDQPIAEVAEDVIGGALSQSASVDPAIQDVMSFKAEGLFTPDALLAEFGEALMDRDVALIRSSQGDLALVLRANLASELARGGTLVMVSAPPGGTGARSSTTAVAPAIVYGRDRWQDGPLGALLLFLSGGLAGAAGLRGVQILRARRDVATVSMPLLISHEPRQPTPGQADDADLTIPTFNPSNRL